MAANARDRQPGDLNFAGIAANIARFTALAVQVNITELDVALPNGPDGNVLATTDLTRQAEIYRRNGKSLPHSPRLHHDPDLGIHRQVLLDSFPIKGSERRTASVRPQLPVQALILGAKGSDRNAQGTNLPPDAHRIRHVFGSFHDTLQVMRYP